MKLPDTFRPVNYTHESRVINATILSELARAQKNQRDLAEFLNLSQSAISRRINSNYDWSFSDLSKISYWLGVNLVRKADQNLVMDHHS